jgi:hypothetical protein
MRADCGSHCHLHEHFDKYSVSVHWDSHILESKKVVLPSARKLYSHHHHGYWTFNSQQSISKRFPCIITAITRSLVSTTIQCSTTPSPVGFGCRLGPKERFRGTAASVSGRVYVRSAVQASQWISAERLCKIHLPMIDVSTPAATRALASG